MKVLVVRDVRIAYGPQHLAGGAVVDLPDDVAQGLLQQGDVVLAEAPADEAPADEAPVKTRKSRAKPVS